MMAYMGVAMAIDRELICSTTLKGFAEPAWEMLPRGFSAYTADHQKHQMLDVEGANIIKVSGPSKQAVGQFAANIRRIRPPEPYKGKGIRYKDEVVLRKVGKTGM